MIRLIDPPLHEFLPDHIALLKELSNLKRQIRDASTLQHLDEPLEEIMAKEKLLKRVEALRKSNPMLGLRGVRLGIYIPELTSMQVRAIFEAACRVIREGVSVKPKIMIPLTSHVNTGRYRLGILSISNNSAIGNDIVAYINGTVSSTALDQTLIISQDASGSDPNGLDINISGLSADLLITSGVSTLPAAPSDVSASDGSYTDKVRLSWNSVSEATSYKLYRSLTYSGSKTLLGIVSGTSYDDTSGTADIIYYYWVKAVNNTEESDYSSYNTGFQKLDTAMIVVLTDTSPNATITTGSDAQIYGTTEANIKIGGYFMQYMENHFPRMIQYHFQGGWMRRGRIYFCPCQIGCWYGGGMDRADMESAPTGIIRIAAFQFNFQLTFR